MKNLLALTPVVLFLAFVGTFVIAPIYFYMARRVERAHLIAITSVVAVALSGGTISAFLAGGPGVSDSVGLRSGIAFMIFILLATGWITSALLYWLYSILARSYPKHAASKPAQFQDQKGPPSQKEH